jgi:beta-mannosidase
VHADALFEGFLDLTYAYKFGPPGHDVVAASLRDVATGTLLAATHYFPGLLPMAARADLGLVALIEPVDGGYALLLTAQRFAHAVAIKLEGWQPDDNYLNLEAGETRRIGLVKTGPGGVPHGQVQALNGRGSVPLAVAEAAHAG